MAAAGLNANRWAGLVLICLLAASAGALLLGWRQTAGVITLEGRMPEAGGWNPGDLKAVAGEQLILRLTSGDVVHGFAVGKHDIPQVPVLPGEITTVTLVFDEPGTYTYYCTRWCGPNHWRMRGTIEVSGGEADSTTSDRPLYLDLGLDLDAPHPSPVIPDGRPSAARGEKWLSQVPKEFTGQASYRAHSPAEIWLELRAETSLSGLDDSQLWDLVAALWGAQASPASLVEGQKLYASNCAACHGENGRGDGVFARESIEEMSAMEMDAISGHEVVTPTDFTDPQLMLGASPALLQGKIVRGGMGTGMPYWGSIFTQEQTWALVSYLWTFQFDDLLEVNE